MSRPNTHDNTITVHIDNDTRGARLRDEDGETSLDDILFAPERLLFEDDVVDDNTHIVLQSALDVKGTAPQ